MGKLKVTDFVLYRWRYILSIVAITGLFLTLLYLVVFVAPGGLSTSEMNSAVQSSHAYDAVKNGHIPASILHLPYRALQGVSISLLGVNLLSVKLVSAVLAAGSVIFLYGLLRLWFRANVAIITTLITVTMSQFLLESQLGTPVVSYLFWSTGILFCASMLARGTRFRPGWLVASTILAGLAIYSPFEIYIVIALLVTSFIHPHARFIIFRQRWWVLALNTILLVVLLLPLILNVIGTPGMMYSLLAIPASFDSFSWSANADKLLDYIRFNTASNGAMLTPPYGLGIILLTLIGLYRLLSAKYTAKSYILTIWIVFTVPVIILRPEAVGLTLLPIILLVAFAFDFLIRSWYRLFPHNPYARVAGLLPLAILMLGLSFSHMERFVYGYHYDSHAVAAYTDDLALTNGIVQDNLQGNIVLLVDNSQTEFYKLYASHFVLQSTSITVTSDVNQAKMKAQNSVIIASGDYRDVSTTIPTQVIASSAAENNDRLYVYKNGFM